jgi:cysteinyl-tRNA synthetase
VALRLYNTLTRKKEPFQPINAGNVRMYVCGPTVYDFAHIGNTRPVIVFDVLFRLLRHLAAQGEWDGGKGETKVTYVRNITDIDDKINARAAQDYPELPLNEAIRRVTEKTEKQFHDDVAALGCLPPTVEPRATEHIAAMKEMIDGLVANGCAYVAEDHVLFDVAAMPDYGKLSGRSLDEMIAGARVEVAPYKRDPMDFVLWKPSKPGEPSWPSPAGIAAQGRPGWHIECSAMSWKHLGETFDIHGGGIDLVFPHHENEIAQSRCAFHTPVMANYWLHNGFLQVEGEKMAKSLGNFVIVHDLLARWPGEVLRLQMLNTHYRQPLDWTEAMTNAAQAELEDWVIRLDDVFGQGIGTLEATQAPSDELIATLCDDLNTPEALSFLRQKAKKFDNDPKYALSFLCDCEFLGLMDRRHLGLLSTEFGGEGTTPEFMVRAFDIYQAHRARIHNGRPGAAEEFDREIRKIGASVAYLPNGGIRLIQASRGKSQIDELIKARLDARKAKDFKEADRIRDELAALGIELKDAKDPETGELVTTWEVAR